MLDGLIESMRPFQFRGKFRVLNPFVPHIGQRRAKLFGYVVDLDLSKPIQRQIYIGNYERPETGQVRALLKPGMTVLDVGANIGYYTALAARMVGPSGKVVAVEPYPPNFQKLSSMVDQNAMSQVATHHLALSDKNGEASMYTAIEGTDAPVMIESGHVVATVPTRRLEQMFKEWNIASVDFMKLDVDGHEPSVLKGAGDFLASGSIRTILCEFCEQWLTRT